MVDDRAAAAAPAASRIALTLRAAGEGRACDVERLAAGAQRDERVRPQLESLEGVARWTWNDPTPALSPVNSTAIRRPYHMIFAVSERAPTAGSSRDPRDARRRSTSSTPTCTSTRTGRRARRVRRAALGRGAARDREGRGAVPRPAGDVAARGVPDPMARRLEPAPDGGLAGRDAPRARRAPRQRGGPVPRSPALARDGARPRVRRRARARVQRLAGRALASSRADASEAPS